ncbi:MAG: DUF4830 domain-containing protein [Oscillospiraceae bacterium]|nr:DUF4830 domain-containing protein [Oscillospiraceae bacterium]
MKSKCKSNLPLVGIGLICVLLIILFIASRIGASRDNQAVKSPNNSTVKINSASDAANFLSEFGWETLSEPSSVRSVTIPAEFDEVYSGYNRLQKSQGFDLTDYRAKTATMYTFRLLNYPAHENSANGRVFANVLVSGNGEVIAGDIVSYALDGFLTGLDGQLTVS